MRIIYITYPVLCHISNILVHCFTFSVSKLNMILCGKLHFVYGIFSESYLVFTVILNT